MGFFGGPEIRLIEEEKTSFVLFVGFCFQFGLCLWEGFFWGGVNLLDLSGYDEGVYRITWIFS